MEEEIQNNILANIDQLAFIDALYLQKQLTRMGAQCTEIMQEYFNEVNENIKVTMYEPNLLHPPWLLQEVTILIHMKQSGTFCSHTFQIDQPEQLSFLLNKVKSFKNNILHQLKTHKIKGVTTYQI